MRLFPIALGTPRPMRGGPVRRSLVTAGLLASFGLGACTGTIGNGGESGAPAPNTNQPGSPSNPGGGNNPTPVVPNTPDPSGPTPGAPDRTNEACKTIQPGPSFMRRLSRKEFDNTVRDLTGEALNLAKDFPPEELHHGYDNAGLRTVSDALAEKYLAAAEKVSKSVTGKLPTVLSCDPAQKGDDACLDAFFDGFGKRIWRRPLEDGEKQRLRTRFKEMRGASFNEGLDAVIQIMVLSPSFLYRTERGLTVAGENYQKVAPFEMASRLSYLLWGSMPDGDLFSAAEANKLGTRAEVLAQAKRMIADPRASEMVAHFGAQWLSLERLDEVVKDTELYPDYKPELHDLFRTETAELVKAIWNDGAKLETFITSPTSYMNKTLATFYGVPGPTGDAFQKVELDPKQRAGVLTQGSVMLGNASADQTSPIKRGLFIQDRFVCFEVPEPPADLEIKPVELNATMTTRERFAAHRMDPSCNGCHQYIDPIGFAFEHIDAIGKWRDKDNGKAIDASGSLIGTDVDGAYDGAVGLAQKLSKSEKVRHCVAEHWFRFAYGRDADKQQDACAIQAIDKAFDQSGGDFRELVLALTQTDAFMFRQGGTQ